MKKAIAVVVGLVVAALTVLSLALAGPASAHDRGKACRDASAAFDAQLLKVLDLGKDKFPGDVLPALANIDLNVLNAVLNDSDTGQGGKEVVKTAIDLLNKKIAACNPPVTTTVPVPTTTVTPPVTTVVPGPTVIVQQPRVIRVPQGSVDTGGGPV